MVRILLENMGQLKLHNKDGLTPVEVRPFAPTSGLSMCTYIHTFIHSYIHTFIHTLQVYVAWSSHVCTYVFTPTIISSQWQPIRYFD